MLSFRTQGGAKISYAVYFDTFSYANISFFDPDHLNIPFHLSLRQDQGLAVCNARQQDVWSEELPTEVTFLDGENRIEIAFAEEEVRVALNGVDVLRFDKIFPDISVIEAFDFSGGIRMDSIAISGALNDARPVRGALAFQDHFALEGWAYDPALEAQKIEIRVAGVGEGLYATAFTVPDLARAQELPFENIGVYAAVPGRIWRELDDGRDAEITLYCNDIVCSETLSFSRGDAVASIEKIMQTEEQHLQKDPAAVPDQRAALLALEHVRFGNLNGLLSEAAQAYVQKVAQRYGVEPFLAPAQLKGEAPSVVLETDVDLPGQKELDLVRQSFVESIRAQPHQAAIDVLKLHLAQEALLPEARQRLLVMLTDFFCNRNEYSDLYALLASEEEPLQLTDDMTHNVLILPYLYYQGRADDILNVLWRLAKPTDAWVSTTAVGWLATQLAEQDYRYLNSSKTEAAIYAFFEFVNRLARAYWEQAPCEKLEDATVQLIRRAPSFADYMQKDIRGFSLSAYGLSARFWRQLDALVLRGDIVLDPLLEEGRKAFAVIAARVADGTTDVTAALRVFESFHATEANRVRLELLGPSGVDTAGEPVTPAALLQERRDVHESALRTLAFPGVHAPDLAPLARKTIAKRFAEQPYLHFASAPFHDLQGQTSRRILEILQALQRGEALDPEVLTQTLPNTLASLAGQRSGFIGLAMGIDLITGLLRLGHDDMAATLQQALTTKIARLPAEEIKELRKASALYTALWGLLCQVDPENPVAQQTFALFPNISASLPPRPEETRIEAQPGGCEGSMFDTLVVVFSCKPYLETRVQDLRDSWLKQLADFNIPYVVVVGEGTGKLDGDVLRVDAPDDYEGLPQKTLKTIEWVHNNTAFAHMLKIDDDCFLNVEAFFHSQSYRKFDYYGRRINRRIGDMDRNWHSEKSTTQRGRYELDKSPEPAVYADGGSGYVLNRRAMKALQEILISPQSRHVLQSSFMEDKLVGDLLQMAGISLGEEDYYMSILRRTHGAAIPVSLWVNSFYPSQAAEIKLIHLDGKKPQTDVLNGMQETTLSPRKIWPSFQRTRLGFDTNALELVSSEEKLFRVNAEPLAVVACVRNEMFMLPHFLAHYRKLGVKSFLIADNCSDDGTLEYLEQQPDVAVFSVDTQYAHSMYGVAWQQALISNFRVNRWSLIADADELLVYAGWEKEGLSAHLARPAFAEADAVRIFMLDMYPKGPLDDATFESNDPFAEAGYVDAQPFRTDWMGSGPYSNSETFTSALRHRLIPGSRPEIFVGQKVALLKYRPWMHMSAGLHYASGMQLATQDMLFAHFKYNAEFRKKAAAEVARRQHFNNAEEYRKYLAVLSEGREEIYDPDISVPWQECAFVQNILSPQE